MTNWDKLVGHEWAVELLQSAISHDRVGHAYLLTGPEHIGKTTLARLFVQALNCEEPEAGRRPCGRCRPCTLIAADRHPDVRLVEPEVTGRGQHSLKIDRIRELQHDLSLATYEARYKVAILVHFDAASIGAANAFLKTLEEPPARAVLVLTATAADALLPTITSRCRVIALRPLPMARIASALQERWHVPPDEAQRLAHLADGRLGWALQAQQTPELLQERDERMALLNETIGGTRVARFALAEKLAKEPEVLPQILQVWLTWWRDLALLAWGRDGGRVVNVDRQAEMQALARQWQHEQIIIALQHTREALWQLAHNANTRLVLENLFLCYPQENGNR